MTKNDLKLYSAGEVESARAKGQMIGLIQGAGGMLLLGFAFSLIGWIPIILVGVLVVVVVAKLLSR